MLYKLNDAELSSFGAHPFLDNVQDRISLSGLFDLPKRKGTIEHNWGTSIEALVDESDIKLDGRTLILKVCIKGNSLDDYLAKLDAYKSACITCRSLWTEFGAFGVVMKDILDVEEYATNFMAIITAKFWHQDCLLPKLAITPSEGSIPLFDSYNLSGDFGIYITSRSDDKNISKRIEVSTTLPYTRTQYREPRNVTFGCIMSGDDLQDLYHKIKQFQALCMSPGLRKLKLSGNESYDLYFKDGMTVKVVSDTLLMFDLKCRIV